jgi:hypothetical protein
VSTMSYLLKFAATTRLKVDMELAEKFDFDMRREGDKRIRDQMAKARRAATMVSNLLADFKDMPGRQVAELEQSSAALRKLADSLESLAVFAKAYHAYYMDEIKRQDDEALETLALNRWGTDDEAAAFELALIQELSTKDGGVELGRWLHAQGRYTDISEDRFHSPFGSHSLSNASVRLKAASYLREVMGSFHKYTDVSASSKHCHVGMQDYEMFLAARKDAAKMLNSITLASKSSSKE